MISLRLCILEKGAIGYRVQFNIPAKYKMRVHVIPKRYFCYKNLFIHRIEIIQFEILFNLLTGNFNIV